MKGLVVWVGTGLKLSKKTNDKKKVETLSMYKDDAFASRTPLLG